MKISTEGVLVFASAQGLCNEYKDKEFDYDFPNGLSKLLEQQAIIALTTSDGDNLIIEFVDNKTIQENFDKEIEQVITLSPKDKLLILSHAEFTQICDANGDSENYRWPIEKIESIEAGKYLVNIKVKNTSSEFEKHEAYFKLTVSMTKIENSKISNEVLEISN